MQAPKAARARRVSLRDAKLLAFSLAAVWRNESMSLWALRRRKGLGSGTGLLGSALKFILTARHGVALFRPRWTWTYVPLSGKLLRRSTKMPQAHQAFGRPCCGKFVSFGHEMLKDLQSVCGFRFSRDKYWWASGQRLTVWVESIGKERSQNAKRIECAGNDFHQPN